MSIDLKETEYDVFHAVNAKEVTIDECIQKTRLAPAHIIKICGLVFLQYNCMYAYKMLNFVYIDYIAGVDR